MSRLTVVMLARDQADLTLRAVEAALKELATVGGGELVLVDQASSDGTADLVAEAARGRAPLRLLRHDESVPYAAAANAAAREANSPLLLFLDNDTELLPDALATLVAAIEEDEHIAAVGPKLLYPSGQIQEAGLALPLWLVPMPLGANHRADDHRFCFPRSAFALSSSCLLVRRGAFTAVSGFHEGYAWGFEAADLALALRKRGFRVLYEPRATCLHEGGATLSRFPSLPATEANRKVFLERWGVEVLRRVAGYLDRLAEDGTRGFLIYGTGEAGRHLAQTLEIGGYDVAGFLSSNGVRAVGPYPAWNVREVRPDPSQRVLIGSPYVREAEDTLAQAGLLAGAALPILYE